MLVTTLTVPVAQAELAADRLWSCGARGVEERPAGDEVELRTTLGSDGEGVRRRLGDLPPSWRLGFVEVDDEPATTWREFARPVEVGERLVIVPAWWRGPAAAGRDDALVVSIDPGGAFGLGDHPTTRLSAAAVDRLVRAGDSVLDVGCGSGVLGVVAALRGAASVTAVDVADEAVEATRRNADLNGVGGRIAVSSDGLALVDGEFDVVVANILAPALVQLADDLVRVTSPDGVLVVSGVLDGAYAHVVEALSGLDVVDVEVLDGWAAVTLRRSGRVSSPSVPARRSGR